MTNEKKIDTKMLVIQMITDAIVVINKIIGFAVHITLIVFVNEKLFFKLDEKMAQRHGLGK